MKYRYHVTKIWYQDYEIVESDVPLDTYQVRQLLDENRLCCDEIIIDQIDEGEEE